MAVRVGINGFGRIGRNFLRAALEQAADRRPSGRSRWSASTTSSPPPPTPTSSSTTRRTAPWPSRSATRTAPSPSATTPSRCSPSGIPRPCPGPTSGVDVVVESTGIFTDRAAAAAHIEAGAPRVIISAPATNVDATFVIGVNDDTFDPAQHTHRLQRVVHDQLLRADGQGARRRLRGREGPDDHGPRLHQRPEPARPGPQGPAPGPGGARSTSCRPPPGRPGPPAWSWRR